LQRGLTGAELQRAQQLGQTEFRAIAEALAPPKPSPPPAEPTPSSAASARPPTSASDDLPSWPKAPADQVRAIQQALADLQLLRDKPDGVLGPMTRNAIRDFQRGAGLRISGEPSKEVYLALRQALIQRDIASSPLPLPAKQEPPKSEPQQAAAQPEPPAAPVAIDLGKREPPAIDLANSEPPPPPTSIDFARATAKVDTNAWPADGSDQVRVIQGLLRELKILGEPVSGEVSTATRAAIREYQRLAGLKETGEPSEALFDSLKEMRALMVRKTGSN
jgi:peptidoglycan hydrolase-like protein with peptidoglycan-binding domain